MREMVSLAFTVRIMFAVEPGKPDNLENEFGVPCDVVLQHIWNCVAKHSQVPSHVGHSGFPQPGQRAMSQLLVQCASAPSSSISLLHHGTDNVAFWLFPPPLPF